MGVDFGSPDKILVAYEQDEQPENLIEHPMSINMKENLKKFLSQNSNKLLVSVKMLAINVLFLYDNNQEEADIIEYRRGNVR